MKEIVQVRTIFFVKTGGLGFIRSHTAVTLLEDNYDVVIIDNLINSKKVPKIKLNQ